LTSSRWCILLDFLQQNVNLILNLQVHAGFVNEHCDTSIIYAIEQWLASLYGWTNWSGNTHYMTIVTRVNNKTEWQDDHPEWLKWLYFSGDWVTAPGLKTHSLNYCTDWLTDWPCGIQLPTFNTAKTKTYHTTSCGTNSILPTCSNPGNTMPISISFSDFYLSLPFWY